MAEGRELGRFGTLAVCLGLGMVSLSSVGHESTPGAKQVSPGFDPDRVTWQRLDYTASKLFVTLRSTVELQRGGPWDVEPWLSPPQGVAASPIPAEIADHRLSLETSVLGRRSLEAVRFRGEDGRAVQRYKRRFGSRAYAKTQRYLEQGAFLTRVSPAEPSEVEEAQWSRRSNESFQLPQGSECSAVVDSIQIFYLLAASSIDKVGDAFSVCAFTKDTFARLEISAVETVARGPEHRIDGVEMPDGAASARGGPLLWLSLNAEPLPGPTGAAESRFELIGLEGALRILFDPEARLPMEIRGKHEKMGPVSVRLSSVQQRTGAP